MLRIPAVVATCAAVLLVASACTDDEPEPNFSSVSTSATPTASPTPSVPGNTRPGETAPTAPAEAEVNDVEGAQAFATYYVKTIDWVFATADVDLLQPFYSATCTTCDGRITYLTDLFAGGQSLQGGRVSILASQIVDNDGRLGATFAVSTAVSVEASTVLSSAGATASTLPSTASATLTTWLQWNGASWVIVEERST